MSHTRVIDVIESIAKKVLGSDELVEALHAIEHAKENGVDSERPDVSAETPADNGGVVPPAAFSS